MYEMRETMNLHSLLNGLKYVVLQEVISLKKVEIKGLTCNSRRVEGQDVFVCMDGENIDGCLLYTSPSPRD